MFPAAFAASTRSPTFTSEIALDSPDSRDTVSEPAKQAVLPFNVAAIGVIVGDSVGVIVGDTVGEYVSDAGTMLYLSLIKVLRTVHALGTYSKTSTGSPAHSLLDP